MMTVGPAFASPPPSQAPRGCRPATCPPSGPWVATSYHPLPVPGQEEGEPTVSTEQERKEAQPGTSSSTPSRVSEREAHARLGSLTGHMKAIVRDTYGSSDVLELRDIDIPECAD